MLGCHLLFPSLSTLSRILSIPQPSKLFYIFFLYPVIVSVVHSSLEIFSTLLFTLGNLCYFLSSPRTSFYFVLSTILISICVPIFISDLARHVSPLNVWTLGRRPPPFGLQPGHRLSIVFPQTSPAASTPRHLCSISPPWTLPLSSHRLRPCCASAPQRPSCAGRCAVSAGLLAMA